MYIADYSNHVVRKVTIETGIITTIAGNNGILDYVGDGGAATSAGLVGAAGVAVDNAGTNVLLAYFLFVCYSIGIFHILQGRMCTSLIIMIIAFVR